jgi:hypothetical protein
MKKLFSFYWSSNAVYAFPYFHKELRWRHCSRFYCKKTRMEILLRSTSLRKESSNCIFIPKILRQDAQQKPAIFETIMIH